MKNRFTKEQLLHEYIELEKTSTQIGKEFGCSNDVVLHWLKKIGIPRFKKGRSGGRNFKDLTGMRFGKLFVLKRADGITEAKGRTKWFCQCDCGRTKSVESNSLRKNLTKSCGCIRINKNLESFNELSCRYWNRIVNGANIRNLVFEISMEQAWEVYVRQDKKCALSGLPIVLVKNLEKDRILQTASLDRIDSLKGYTLDNIQWLHKNINLMKNNHTETEFKFLCERVTKYAKSKKLI